MADDKALTNLEELTTLDDADLLYATDMDEAAGYRSKKITAANVKDYIFEDPLEITQIQFLGAAAGAGLLYWNDTARTLDLTINGVTLQLGQETVATVRNTSGVDIANGQVCMVTGTLGASGKILVAPYIADGTYEGNLVIGIATEDIANGADGFVTRWGAVREIDTTAWNEGDILYSDYTTPGGLTNVAPPSPYPKDAWAIVISSKVSGTIAVRVNPHSPHATSKSLVVGGMTDYLEVDENGYLTLNGGAAVYDDVRVPITAVRIGAAKVPDFVIAQTDGSGSQGVGGHGFDPASEEQAYFVLQLPHAYKHGSALEAHVHWTVPNGNGGNVVWGIEYTWANIGEVFSNTVLSTATGAAGATPLMHLMTEIVSITGTDKIGSSMLMARVYRDATNVADTYASDAVLLEVDFHMLIDKLGSAEEYPSA